MKELTKKVGTPVCVGTGLVALDVVMNGNPLTPPQLYAGGSCGNVLTILSFLGWNTYPIARLAANKASQILLRDLKQWNVNYELLSFSDDGSTPIIIHRILTDKFGKPKHRFEFKDPSDGSYLPSYKPYLSKSTKYVFDKIADCKVFYFDRINRASIELAREYKSRGALVFFEPSSNKEQKLFNECLAVCDIIKFSDERIKNYNELYNEPAAEIEVRTLGEAGLQIRTRQKPIWVSIPSFTIRNVVDTAGAGDWCSAGMLYKLYQSPNFLHHNFDEKELIDAIKFGQALSAFNCTLKGARGLMYHYRLSDIVENSARATQETEVELDSMNGQMHQIFANSELVEIKSLL